MSTLPAIPESFAMTNQLDSIETFQMPHIPVRTITGVIAIILLIGLAWTSCYTVQAESEGVVLRFGKFLKTVEPGLHFKLPFGIDQWRVQKADIETQRSILAVDL